MYARDFRDLVAYKAFSSDYIAVPLLDRESPYVSHCARARARSYHGKRAILDLERTREGKSWRIWTRIDKFFFFRKPSEEEKSKARGIFTIAFDPASMYRATIGCRSANTSFGKSYRLSSTVCRSARLPSARSTELSFLSRTLSLSPPDKKIARLSPVSISKRNEKNNSRFVREERECGNFAGTFEDSFEVVISHAKRKPLYTYRWNE